MTPAIGNRIRTNPIVRLRVAAPNPGATTLVTTGASTAPSTDPMIATITSSDATILDRRRAASRSSR